MVTGMSLIVVFAFLHIGPKVNPIGCEAVIRFEQKLIIGSPQWTSHDIADAAGPNEISDLALLSEKSMGRTCPITL